jgi:hypothetical protein
MRRFINKLNLDRSTVSTVSLLSAISSFALNILCTAFLYVKEALFGNLFPIILLTVCAVSTIIFSLSTKESKGTISKNPYWDEDLDYKS